MSESPGLSGAEETELLDDKSGMIQRDDNDDVIPNKRMKSTDPAVDEDEYDDAVLEEDLEEDLEQGDLVDGNDDITSDDAAIDDVGESSDVDEFIQANLAHINECQSEMERLNKDANDEILKVEQRYNQLRLPIYAKRNNHIEQIPHFWSTVFSKHPQLRQVVTSDDLECLEHLIRIQISDFDDGKSGYQMQFFFSPNPWFSNSVITKEYHLPWNDAPSCSCTPIDWFSDMDLTGRAASFFCWFCSQEDASTDDIAEIIKEELWPDPLQCYLIQPSRVEDSDRGSADGSDDEVELECASSEDERTWKKQPALGKEVPGSSKDQQSYSSEGEEELDDASDNEEYDDDILEERQDPEEVEKDLGLPDGEKSNFLAEDDDNNEINEKNLTLDMINDEIQAAISQSTDPGT